MNQLSIWLRLPRHIAKKLENGDLHFKLAIDWLDRYASTITVVGTRIADSILGASIVLVAHFGYLSIIINSSDIA